MVAIHISGHAVRGELRAVPVHLLDPTRPFLNKRRCQRAENPVVGGSVRVSEAFSKQRAALSVGLASPPSGTGEASLDDSLSVPIEASQVKSSQVTDCLFR